MESFKIIGLCIAAAVFYGICHDQVTARVCVEYFTIGHPPVFQTDSPTLLAFGWGAIATWWVGAILGIAAAASARLGSRPKFRAAGLLRPLGVLLIVTACVSLAAGIAGYFAATSGSVWLLEPLASRVPAGKHIAFITDVWAHLAAYATGFLGGIAICVWIVMRRGRMAVRAPAELQLTARTEERNP
jgi:hypothetical protein